MKRLVMDANVLVKLFFEEPHSQIADKIFSQAEERLAPDLIWVEASNVIWKRYRRGDISKEHASGIAAQLLAMPLNIRPSAELIPEAMEIAIQFDRTVYDGLYVALAVKAGCPLLSSDQRLVSALRNTPLAKHILWIGDYS